MYTATVIYDNRPEGFNREIPLALNADILVTEDEAMQISFFGFYEAAFLDSTAASIVITQQPANGILTEISETYQISGDDKVA